MVEITDLILDGNYYESMIEYYGKHPCKQSIRNKPIRLDFKACSLNKPDGYCVDFSLYQGNYYDPSEKYPSYETEFGKCTAPLLAMIDEMDEEVQELPLHFVTDNLFTFHNLMLEMKKRGYGLTGTFRAGRHPKGIPLASKEAINKRERGSMEYTLEVGSNV